MKPYYLLLTFSILFSSLLTHGQDSVSYSYPNMNQCVALSLQKHPIAKTATLEVRKKEVLEKSAFNPDGLAVNYGYGNLNSSMLDYSFDVAQNFDFPTEYMSKKKLLQEEKRLSQSQLTFQKISLRKETQTAYNTLLFHKNRLLLLIDFNQHFELFESIAEEHFQADSTLALEHASAYARHQEILVLIEQEKLDISIAKNNLIRWTNYDQIKGIRDSVLQKVAQVPENTFDHTSSPFELIQQAEFNVAQQEIKVNKAVLAPDISVGYFRHQIDGQQGFDGLLLGTSIPLFFTGQRREIQASSIESEKIAMDIQTTQNMVIAELSNQTLLMKKFDNMIRFFEEQGVTLSNELVAGADERFQLGEIGYVEYLRDLDQAFGMTSQYLENLRDYNEAWFTIEFLTSGDLN